MSPTADTSHPYFPKDALIPNYMPNTASLEVILRGFAGLIVVFIASGLYVAKRINPALQIDELAAVAWFLLCFFLHAFFEGYFVLYHNSLAASQSLFAQLWKEYALSDSRYMTSDPFMLCIESLTVLLWAPLCFAIVICIIDRNRMRYPLQIIMCVGHLFGVALYYGTCFFEYRYRGISHSRPEFLYYWVYYLGLNAAWVVLPAMYLFNGVWSVNSAMQQLDSLDSVTQLLTATKKEVQLCYERVEEAKKRIKQLKQRSTDLRKELKGLESEQKSPDTIS
ncbi:EBP-domain-containing protein [Coniochaeta ligniaria NRRL 30616]|uniref:EBP-domain-containing protein n=1 Tax=Coniochaeta ligniaria NRRL 30616 TaxID=1408157 RepID=A0A1J7JZL1_9PEZI|nr:EBP-domain-containing protein [Coniochaeta ligniaria NRRL 30616]